MLWCDIGQGAKRCVEIRSQQGVFWKGSPGADRPIEVQQSKAIGSAIDSEFTSKINGENKDSRANSNQIGTELVKVLSNASYSTVIVIYDAIRFVFERESGLFWLFPLGWWIIRKEANTIRFAEANSANGAKFPPVDVANEADLRRSFNGDTAAATTGRLLSKSKHHYEETIRFDVSADGDTIDQFNGIR